MNDLHKTTKALIAEDIPITQKLQAGFVMRALVHLLDVTEARIKAHREYVVSRDQLRVPPHDPKIKDEPRLTDFDRTTMLEAYSAEQRMCYEQMKADEELLRLKIELIKEMKWS